MTSQDRRENRYQRRKAEREQKKQEFHDSLPGYEEVFSYENLYNAFYKCKQGVMWKASIQAYQVRLPINTYEIYSQLMDGTYKSRGFVVFGIHERGKARTIKSVHISERCIQRCLCDHYLVPLLSHNLIYDNGASLKNKGTDFSIRRLKEQLEYHYLKYGLSGYIVLFDFRNYFGNIDHEVLYKIIDEKIQDKRIKKLYHQFIDAFGDVGLGLGSQVCQISAITFANKLDHAFKDQFQKKGYGRYMDDGYAIAKDLDEAKMFVETLYKICEELKIQINPNKIKIIKLTRGFTFLKKRFSIQHGKVVIKPLNKAFKKTRLRLNKFETMLEEGTMTYKHLEGCYKSWRGSIKQYQCGEQLRRCDELFNEKFIRRWQYGY